MGDAFGEREKQESATMTDRYPDFPGYRDGETSREAAEEIAPSAPMLRDLVFDCIKAHPRMTAEDGANPQRGARAESSLGTVCALLGYELLMKGTGHVYDRGGGGDAACVGVRG
jgi:hypothetical protein